LINTDVPESLTVTRGTTTPTSKFGVTPTVPDSATVLLVSFRFAVDVPAARPER
jgi:hypothetical protein